MTKVHYLNEVIDEKQFEYAIKVLFVGDSSTLKLRQSLQWKTYKRDNNSTPPDNSNAVNTKQVEIYGKLGKVVYSIYDNNIGRETSYFPFQGIHVLCVVFDTNDNSVENVCNWYEEAKRFCGNKDMYTFIVGYNNNLNRYEPPNHVSNLMHKKDKIFYFNYTKQTSSLFYEKLDDIYALVRKSTLGDDLVDQQNQVKPSNYNRKPSNFNEVQRSTFSSQPNTVDKKRVLVNVTDKITVATIKTLVLGDPCVSDYCQKICVGLSVGWSADRSLYSFNDCPVKTIPYTTQTSLKIRTYVYDHSIGRGASYTPYFNILGCILCFDFNDQDSFSDLMNWYNETLRYCNLRSTHYFVVGCNYTEDAPVTDDDVQSFLDYFPMSKKPPFFKYFEGSGNELDETFMNFIMDVAAEEFPQNYLDECAQNKQHQRRVTVANGERPAELDNMLFGEDKQSTKESLLEMRSGKKKKCVIV
ncbi:Uncharacterized protein QTN25_001263 [Entamoeba marina]